MVIEKNLTFIREAGTTIKISRFVFMSSCYGAWGGSEELWSSTAKYLKQQGHEVYIYKTNPPYPERIFTNKLLQLCSLASNE
ncbi:hypothetical protein H6G03_34335 [Planktothrix sp. FACHB-1375]|uniref:Uncharacterized protein n=2 Tax=Aerosakkonema funiforme TaxID=1246630 RepID=A0A926ZL67_9CYAN|nr:hypothetical protein [Aerosakkonema funiforme FACHB-1375]